MRIDGWHADGFGILKDFERADLEPGVTVLLGENEAGKSTLLAFVRAMLFGFPGARTSTHPRRSWEAVTAASSCCETATTDSGSSSATLMPARRSACCGPTARRAIQLS